MNERQGTRDTDNGRDPAELERDIDRTRASLGRTVDALESRLSPGELLDQALGLAREHGGDFATNLGRSVRNNPMPVVLTGVGLAWMMASSNEPRASSRTYSGHEIPDHGSDAKSRLKSGVSSAKSAAGSIGDTASRATRSVKGSLDSLGESASGAGERMRMESQRIRHGFEYLIEEQPLMVGALGIAIGAALGAALPRTEAEDRMLGETSDSALQSVRQKASEAYEDVKDTAAEVVRSQSGDESQRSLASEGEAKVSASDRNSGGGATPADTEWRDSSNI